MLHTPPTAAQLAAYAARGAYTPPPNQTSPTQPTPVVNAPYPQPTLQPTTGNAGMSNAASAVTGPFTLTPLQQRESMQREAWEKERTSLLKKATNSQGDSVERLVRNYLSV